MITLMAFSVNRSNMGRGLVGVFPTYQGWQGRCAVLGHMLRSFAAAGLRPWCLHNREPRCFRLFASEMVGNPNAHAIVQAQPLDQSIVAIAVVGATDACGLKPRGRVQSLGGGVAGGHLQGCVQGAFG